MFYSHDLLGRKTPLGAIWTLAHGRRLSKGKIISINLREICQEILQPGVPHSLRLQGILIGGLVIVYNKQQAYLLEDLQEMMRKVKAAGKGGGTAGADAAGASAAAERHTLKKGRNQAKLESITLLNMEDLLAPVGDGMGVAGTDDYFLLDAASSGMNFSLNPSSSSQGGSRASKRSRTTSADEEVADGLFIMPSLPAEPALSGLTTTTDQQPKPSRSRSRGVSWAADTDSKGRTEELQQQDDVYGGLAHGAMGGWHQEDEMFDINVDLDLLGGMDLGALHPTAPAAPAAGTTSEQLSQQPSTSTAPGSTDLPAGHDPTLLPSGDQFAIPETDFDQQFEQFDHDFDQLPTLDPTPADAAPSKSKGASEAAAEQDKDEQGNTAEGAAPGAAVRKSKKRKASMLIIDDLDNLQIRSKVYREWVTDHTSLVDRSLLKGTAGARSILAGSGAAGLGSLGLAAPSRSSLGLSSLHDPAVLLADPSALHARLGLGTGAAGAGLCGELQELFRAPVEAAAAAAEQKQLAMKRLQPSSPEVNNSTDIGHIQQRRERPANPNFNQLHLTRTDPLNEHEEEHSEHVADLLDPMLMVMPEINEDVDQQQEQQHHEALSNDEAHDQLMELPFADDEVERLRAAGPGSTDSGSLQFSSPRSAAAALAGRGAKRAESDASGSSMMHDMPYDGPAVDSVGMAGGLRRALRMSDVEAEAQGGMFFGAGRLEDLLPDIPLPDLEPLAEEEEQHQQLSPEPSDKSFGSREATPSVLPNSSQYPLIEETEGHEATQAAQRQAGLVTHASRNVLSIFCERLAPKEIEADETQDSQAPEAGAASDTAARSISLFGLMKEGQLSRSAAATLFYQVCVTSSAGYITAIQERPFGDIIIKAGRNMPIAV